MDEVNEMHDGAQLLNTRQVALKLGFTTGYVNVLVKQGKLRPIAKLTSGHIFTLEEVQRYLREREPTTAR
jgi:predicted site-specific integrase-resolvase